MNNQLAFIRADASVQIGMGHRVRCQALANALRTLGWQVSFVVHKAYADFADAFDTVIQSEAEFFRLSEKANLVILDHYQYCADDIAQLYQHQTNLLVLDDMNDRGVFPTRWLLNPLSLTYSSLVESPLTGGQYALLRPMFSHIPHQHYQANQLLITLGGTDPLALTLPLMQSLVEKGFPGNKLHVLLGENATNAEQVVQYCEQHHILWDQGLNDVASLMQHAKLAISAAGGTLFELACVGIPTVFAQVANNQTKSLEEHVPLGWCHAFSFDDLSETERPHRIDALTSSVLRCWANEPWLKQARSTALGLVDGKGAQRVAERITADCSLN